MSTKARHVCYFFDYGALSLYSLGTRRFSWLILSCMFCSVFENLAL